MSNSYRKGVGIFLISDKKKVWVGKRLDSDKYWQMPQGGIDTSETELQAMKRELKEETGIDNVKVLCSTKDWLKYDLPLNLRKKIWKGKYVGQLQKWYACEFLGRDSDIKLDTFNPEFKEWKWVEPQTITENVIPFKKNMYVELLENFKKYYT